MEVNKKAQRNMDRDVEENQELYEAFATTPDSEE